MVKGVVWDDSSVTEEGGGGTLNWCDGRGYRVYLKYILWDNKWCS